MKKTTEHLSNSVMFLMTVMMVFVLAPIMLLGFLVDAFVHKTKKAFASHLSWPSSGGGV